MTFVPYAVWGMRRRWGKRAKSARACPKDDAVTDGGEETRLTSDEHEPNNAQTKAGVRKRFVFSTPRSLRPTYRPTTYPATPLLLFDHHPYLRPRSPRHRTARPAAAPGGADPRADLDASFNLFISRENPASLASAASSSRSFELTLIPLLSRRGLLRLTLLRFKVSVPLSALVPHVPLVPTHCRSLPSAGGWTAHRASSS